MNVRNCYNCAYKIKFKYNEKRFDAGKSIFFIVCIVSGKYIEWKDKDHIEELYCDEFKLREK